jgi:hypothetical protein
VNCVDPPQTIVCSGTAPGGTNINITNTNNNSNQQSQQQAQQQTQVQPPADPKPAAYTPYDDAACGRLAGQAWLDCATPPNSGDPTVCDPPPPPDGTPYGGTVTFNDTTQPIDLSFINPGTCQEITIVTMYPGQSRTQKAWPGDHFRVRLHSTGQLLITVTVNNSPQTISEP